jgi:hypothetical protein
MAKDKNINKLNSALFQITISNKDQKQVQQQPQIVQAGNLTGVIPFFKTITASKAKNDQDY